MHLFPRVKKAGVFQGELPTGEGVLFLTTVVLHLKQIEKQMQQNANENHFIYSNSLAIFFWFH